MTIRGGQPIALYGFWPGLSMGCPGSWAIERANLRHGRNERHDGQRPNDVPFEWEKVANAVRQRDADGYKCTLIVVAEGAKPKNGEPSYHHSIDGEHRLGGIGEIVTA